MLGFLGAALGAARLLSGGANVSGTPPDLQDRVGLATVAGVPVPFLVAAGLAPASGFLLAYLLRRAQLPDRVERGRQQDAAALRFHATCSCCT